MRGRLLRDESGAMLVLVGLLLPVLLGMVGLAMDAANVYLNRRRMQGVADLASLAAAQKLALGSSVAKKAAEDMAAANGFQDGTGKKKVKVDAPWESKTDLVRVELSDSVAAIFARVVGIKGAKLRVSAVARAGGIKPVIWAQSTSCSTNPNTDLPFYWSGSDGVWTIPLHSNGSMTVAGTNNTFTEWMHYGCTLTLGPNNTYLVPARKVEPRPWPLVIDPKKWKCDFYSSKDLDLSNNGAWWENFGLRILKPGVYCAEGKLTLKANSASGRVTFYSKGDMTVEGKTMALSAFVDNVLFYSEASGNNAMGISGSGGSMVGVMIARNGLLKYTGSDNAFVNGSMYAHRIHIAGSNWQMTGPQGGRTRLVQ